MKTMQTASERKDHVMDRCAQNVLRMETEGRSAITVEHTWGQHKTAP